MSNLIPILLCVGVLAFMIWMLRGASPDRVIDPSDSHQIGLLIGMTGGSIADAAVARYALQRFEEMYGRKATTRDAGTVVGIMMAGK